MATNIHAQSESPLLLAEQIDEQPPGSQPRVALGVCGGIAAYKAAEVLRGLQRHGCRVRVCMTERACEFIQPLTFRALSGEHVIVDDYAPDNPDPIAHITFSQTADLLLIAPATANIIAKFANGVADDFLTSTYLASTAPVLVAPAMNTQMWQHPATVRNIAQLRADGVRFVAPDEGEMACGTIGPGRLSDPEMIVQAALEMLRVKHQQDLHGERILITSGATREAIDPVRFISNRSSGRMGFALAQAARSRGAEIVVIAGSTTAPEPSNVKVLRALSAEEMRAMVLNELPKSTVFISAAAVADYRPVTIATHKIKKLADIISLELERTPDILAEAAAAKDADLILIGFAAETNDVLEHARAKLARKKLDMIVANDVTQAGAGFENETNIVSLLTRDRPTPVKLPLLTKLETAHRILDELVLLRNAKKDAPTLTLL